MAEFDKDLYEKKKMLERLISDLCLRFRAEEGVVIKEVGVLLTRGNALSVLVKLERPVKKSASNSTKGDESE